MVPGILLIIALATIMNWYMSRRRDDVARQLRDEWGQPSDRVSDLRDVARYHRVKVECHGNMTFLDDRTWSDLELDLVFGEVDRTRSTVGRQRLYHRLRSTHTGEALDRFEYLVQYFADHEEARLKAELLLRSLAHPAGYSLCTLCSENGVTIRWWYSLFPLLGLTGFAAVIALPFWSPAFLVLVALASVNFLIRISLAYIGHHLVAPFGQVSPLLKSARRLLGDDALGELLGSSQVRSDMRAVSSLATTARWANRNGAMENDLAASTWEYLNLIFLFDANAMLVSSRTLRRNRSSLLRILELVGDVDVAISTASLRAGDGTWSIPDFTGHGSETRLVDAWHPLLRDAVPNSVAMKPGRGLIITGSNMSGKSTFLRTVGLTAVLAQTLNTCPASAYSGPRLKVRSAIGGTDDMVAGKSYYLLEAELIISLLSAGETGDHHLFLLDELFHGTNTTERLAAGEAVLEALPLDVEHRPRHFVIAATHDAELIDMLGSTYDSYHFEETVIPDGLAFEYRLLPGPARTRSAIALLKICGARPEIVGRARARAAELDRTHEGSKKG